MKTASLPSETNLRSIIRTHLLCGTGKTSNPKLVSHVLRRDNRSVSLEALLMVLGLFLASTSQAFAAILQRGTATSGTTTNTSITINKPTGVVSGDVMIVNIAQTGNNTNDPTLSGWTLIDGSSLAGGTARYGAVLYRKADGTEGTSFTFTLGTGVTSAVGSIVAFSGVDVTTPFDVIPGTISVQTSSTAVAATAITTASANAAVIMFGMAAASAPTWSGWTTTSPGALTELYDNQSTTASVGAAWATKATAGTTGAGAATLSANERNGGILIALRPAVTTYTSTGTGGNWSTAATWTPQGVPTVGSNVVIATGAPVTVDVATTLTINNLTIDGSLNAGVNTVSGTGTLTVDAGGTLLIGGTTNFPSNFATTTLSSGCTVNYDGTIAQTINDISYGGNLVISGSGTKTWTEGAVRTVTGNLTVNDGSTLSVGGAYAFTVAGTTTIGNGTSGALSLTNATGIKTFTGAVTINSGATFSESVAAALSFGNNVTITGTLTESGTAAVGIAGSLTNNGTYTASTGVHTFSGTGQTIGGSTTNTIGSVAVTVTYTNTGTLTVGTALSGAGTLTNTSTLNIGGTSSITTLNNSGTATINGSGAISTALANFTNTGTLNLSGSGTITGITNSTGGIINLASSSTITSLNNSTGTSTLNISALTVPTITTLTVSIAGNTVNYMGGGNQTVKDVAYGGNLGISGSGTKTWTEGVARTVTGNLAVNDGSTLSVGGAYAFTVSGTTTIGNGTSGALSLTATGTKTFTGAVIINNGGAINETVAAALSFGSDVSINGTLTENGNATVGVAGNFTNNGTYTASTGTHTFSGATKTIGGSSAISIPTATFTGNYTNSGTLTSSTQLTVTGAAIRLTNNGTITATTALSGTGGVTQGTNGILNIGGTSGITNLDASTNTGNTVNYNGTAQIVNATTYSNLTLSGSLAKTFPAGTTTINGILSLEGTATVTTTGTLSYSTSSTLQYKGSIAQTTGTEFPSTFSGSGGVIINNSIGVTLNANRTISYGLTLTSGILTTTSSYTISPSTVTRTSGYVNGKLILPVATGSQTKTFDIGDANYYTPVTVVFTNVGTAGTLTGSTNSGDHAQIATSTIDPAKTVNRTWTLTPGGGLAFNTATATLNWVSSDVDAGATPGNFITGEYNSSTWNYPLATNKNSTNIQATGLTSFGDFQVGELGCTNPIFTTQPGANACLGVAVTYTTQSGMNNYIWSMPGTQNTDYEITSGGTTATDNKVTLEWLTTGSKTVTVNYTNPNQSSCTYTPASSATTVNDLPAISVAESAASVCQSETAQTTTLAFTTIKGIPYNYTIIWTGGIIAQNGGVPEISPITINVPAKQAAGTYTGTITVTDEFGCESASGIPFTLSVIGTPIIELPSYSYSVCSGGNLTLNSISTFATEIQWYDPDGEYLTEGTDPVIQNITKDGWYSVEALNDQCQTANGNAFWVTVNALPVAAPGNNGPVCAGTALSLTGSPDGMTSYSWTVPNGYTSSLQNPEVSANATVGMSGQYSLTVTDGNGCTSLPVTTEVTVNALPVAAPGNNGPVCAGTALSLTGSPDGMTSYSWTGPNGYTSSLQNPEVSANATVGMSGQYSLTVTDGNGCISLPVTTEVTVNALPVAAPGNNGPVCAGTALSLTGSPDGMTSYSWTGPNGYTSSLQNPEVSANAAVGMSGQYSLTVTDGNGCTSLPVTTEVTVNALPVAAPGNNGPVCAGTALSLTGSPDGMTSYSWTGPNGYTSSLQNPEVSANATVGMSGQYSLTVTDGNGCTSLPVTTEVTVNALPVAAPGNNGPVCAGTTLSLTGSPDGMTSYSWTGPNGYTSSLQNPEVSANAAVGMSGQYSLTVTDGNGCTSLPVTTEVTVNALPVAAPGNNGPVCAGTALSLTGSPDGMTSYSWTGPNGYTSSLQNPEVSANAMVGMSGQYSLTVTDGNGCTSLPVTTEVTVNALPVAAPGNNGPVCAGTALSLTGSPDGMTSYSWTGPNGYTSSLQNPEVSANATVGMSGQYSLTVTDGNGCISLPVTTEVTVNALPVAAPGNNGPVCAGTALSLTGSPDGMTSYSWTGPNGYTSSLQNPEVSANATVGMSGQYSLTVTDGNGCISLPVTTEVTVNALPVAAPSNNGPVCAGTALSLTGSPDGMTSYSWTGPNGYTSSLQNPEVSANAMVGMSGKYSLTVTDGNGCISLPVTTEVTVNALPVAAPGNNGPVCAGTALSLTGSPDGMTSYSWTVPNGYTSSLQNPEVSANAAVGMSGQYSLTVTDGNGCTSLPVTTEVTVNALPVAAPGNNGPVCAGTALSLTGSPDGMTSYSWTGPNGYTSSLQNPEVSANATVGMSGQYSLTVTDGNGCISLPVTTEVTVNALPVAAPGNNGPVCAGTALSLTGSPDGMTSYSWTGPNGYTSSLQNPEVSANAAVGMSGQYSLTVTDGNGCTSLPVTTEVTVNALPVTGNITGGNAVCMGTTLILSSHATGTAPLSLAWSSSDPTIATVSGLGVVTPVKAGTTNITYTVTDGSSTSCQATSSPLTVNVIASPVIGITVNTLDGTTTVCDGLDLNLTATGGGSYSWSGPHGNSSQSPDITVGNFSKLDAGTYTVTVTNGAGCTSSKSIDIAWMAPITFSITGNTSVCMGSTLTLTATPGASEYLWYGPNGFSASSTDNGISRLITSSSDAGTYYVYPSTACGTGSAEAVVTVIPLPAAPGVASPVTYCFNATASPLTASGTGLLWYTSATDGIASANAPTPATNTAVTTSYWVSQTVNGCEGSRSRIDVTVYPLTPAPSVASPVTYCLNDASVPLTATGTTLLWYTTATGGTGSSTAPTPATNTAGTTSYWVSQTLNGCEGPRAQIVITVNPLPNPTIISGPTSVCQGSTGNIYITQAGSNISNYSWFVDGGTIVSGGSTNMVTINWTDAGSRLVGVNYKNEFGCTSATPGFYPVTVKPSPKVTNASLTQTVCSGLPSVPVTLTSDVSGATFTWSASATTGVTGFTTSGTGNIPAQTISTSASTQGTVTYSITPSANGCTGAVTNYTILVNPAPTVTNSPLSQTINSGGTTALVTLTSDVSGTTFTWTASASGVAGFATSGTGTIPVQTLATTGMTEGSVTYAITPSANGCTGPVTNYTVNVIPVLIVTNTSLSQTICSGGITTPVTLTANVEGATFTWFATATQGVSGFTSSGTGDLPAQTITTTGLTQGTVTYEITPSLNGFVGPATPYTVLVNPVPAVTNTPLSQTICSGGSTANVSLLSNVSGTSFTWYAMASGVTGFAASGTNTIPVQTLTTTGTVPGTVTYNITPVANNCTGPVTVYTVNVNPVPTVTNSSLTQTICSGGATTLVPITSNVSGAAFTWTATGTTGVSGFTSGGTGNIPVQTIFTTAATTGTVTYAITPSANGCNGPIKNYFVYVNPNPVLTITGASSVCVNSSGNVYTVTDGMTSYTWNVLGTGVTYSSSGNTLTVNFAATGNCYISLQYTNQYSCSQTISKTVTVNPLPLAPGVTTPVVYCLNDPSVPLNATGNGLSWYTTATGGTGSGTAPVPSTAVAGTISYWVSQTVNSCEGPRAQIDVTVNPRPIAPTVISPVTYCLGTTAVPLTATGNNLLWYISATGGTGSATAPTPSTAIAGNTSYWVSQTVNGCEGPRAQIVVTVNNLPNTPTITGNAIGCLGSLGNIYTTEGGMYNYSWTVSVGILHVNGNTLSVDWTGTATNRTIRVTYIDQNGCKAPTAIKTVTVNNDHTAPTWTTAASSLDRTIECSDAAGLAVAQALFPAATDNFDPDVTDIVKTSGSFVAGSCGSTGTYTNTWTVTDLCGNTSAAYTQVITIIDKTAPVIVGNIDRNVDGCSAADVPAAETTVSALEGLGLTISDNCTAKASLVVTSSDAISGSHPIVVTRTYTIKDACNNSSTIDQIFNISDRTKPTITAPVDVEATIITGCTATGVNLGMPVTGDNCSVASVSNDALQPSSLERQR